MYSLACPGTSYIDQAGQFTSVLHVLGLKVYTTTSQLEASVLSHRTISPDVPPLLGYVCACVSLYTRVSVPWRSEALNPPEVGDRGDCEHPNMGAGNRTKFSGRSESRFNHWAISPALERLIFFHLYFYFMCMAVLPVLEASRGHWNCHYHHQPNITNGCQLPCRFLELNMVPLEEQPILLTIEPCLWTLL